MSSDILNPKNLLLGKILAVAASSCLFGCTLDPYIITAEEEYTRNFIKDFGLVDQKQDWNLAKAATVSINLGPEVKEQVKVYGKFQSKYYLLAELTNLSGTVDVPVDLPKDCRDLLVVTGGRKYYGNLGSAIDCSDMSRGIPNSTYKYDGTNPNPVEYTGKESGYTVTVQHTTKGNGGVGSPYEKYDDKGAYQYFNTQQMSPLISTTPWDKYYSANTQKWTPNPNGWIGLLPESGVFNRLRGELEDWIAAKKAEGHSIVQDFYINTGDDGTFTIFPYYYGTNLKHELGVYLLDENNNPILKSAGGGYTLENFVSFPVFQDRAPGDLQVQPHYDSKITKILITSEKPENIKDDPTDPNNSDKNTPNETPVFEIGTEYKLQDKVRIKRDGQWMTYNDYITQYGSQFHSRVAYHFWVDERKQGEQRPDSFARISNDGIVTPLKPTKHHNNGVAYANVAIATGLETAKIATTPEATEKIETPGVGRIQGVEANFSYKVEEGSGINSVEIAESELNMCIGHTKTLTVTLKDKDGNTLRLDDDKYWNKISVTENWDKDKCHIYKDENTKTIKIDALGSGEFWPTVYVTSSGWNGISAYAHVKIGGHEYSDKYRGESAAMPSDTWKSYFEDESSTHVDQDIFDKIDNATLGTWKAAKVDPAAFSKVTTDYSIVFELGTPDALYLAYDWSWTDEKNNEVHNNEFENEYTYKVDGIEHTSSDFITQKGTSFELPVQDWMIERLKSTGFLMQEKGGITTAIKKMVLRRPLADGEYADPLWKSGGKAAAEQALTVYYNSNKPSSGYHICENCGENVYFSNPTPTVSLDGDASYSNIHYTVTWQQDAGTYTVSKHRPSARSRTVSSREFFNETATDKFLAPGDEDDWKDVNSFWSRLLPHQEEVASYPPNVCMLARSRGYDVKITYGEDEQGNPKPWKGNLGMYLKVLGSYDIVGTDTYTDTYKEYTGNQVYVVYSQNRFNKAADGSIYNQISALSVKHPASGRTFLTFEDMRLTHNGVNPAHFWERSSDRDVNDLIFNITNFGGITNDDHEEIKEEPSEPVDDTNSWLWAVEDLGATDDFDFNDMVMKITSVTRNNVKKDKDGKIVGDPTLMFKKVTFMPLCAGGTLPLFVHYAPEGTGTHYTLRPGAYKEPDLEYSINDSELHTTPSPIADLEGEGDDNAEIHRWFGVNNSTEMINTGMGSGLRTVKEGCTLYLNTHFTLSGFGADGSAKGCRGGLYVTVNDGRTVQNTDDITSGWKNVDGEDSWAIEPPEEGKVSQMFMIVDPDTPWRWPRERVHILNPYPKFTDWVGDMNITERWYNLESNREGYTFPRYDIKK